MRIGIAGCSGTGKSILAEMIAESFGIPFLPAKEITGEILNRDGYDYASGMQVEKFLSTPDRQAEILKKSIEQQSLTEFVTDRTAIDLAAYAILELKDPLKVQKYVDSCHDLAHIYDYIFFCPWQSVDIVDNQKRTLDPWYQMTVHSVELEVANLLSVGIHKLSSDDAEERLEEIKQLLSKQDV